MNRWNALTFSQKMMAVAGTAAILVGLILLLGYAYGVRCKTEGNFVTCDRGEEAAFTPLEDEGGTPDDADSAPLSESDDRPEPVSVEGDAIMVNDQPAGPIVEVTMLTLAEPGWVAVYEDRNGAPGNVLGAARFEEGMHLGEISLLRSTSPGRTYYLILHADTPSRDFDLKKNPPIIDASGASIRSTFRTFAE
ncbi:MAG TPA: hypothetical protein VD967_03570 [Candidatus Paceibacterota bacterium]|nr:hypothetical protein [Candidatus Paceibacterota bacterium]